MPKTKKLESLELLTLYNLGFQPRAEGSARARWKPGTEQAEDRFKVSVVSISLKGIITVLT